MPISLKYDTLEMVAFFNRFGMQIRNCGKISTFGIVFEKQIGCVLQTCLRQNRKYYQTH